MAGSCSGVHHDAGRQRRPVEPRQEILAHQGVQDGCGIEAGRGAIEEAPHAGGVERVGREVVPCRARPGFIRRVHTVAAELSA